MRQVINISLPEQMAEKIQRDVKKGRFSSTSEYIRYIIRSRELAEELYKSKASFPKGWKKLNSLRELR